jgi:xylulose-5-phosphate/fructose-6-phosphate phosphoketolase
MPGANESATIEFVLSSKDLALTDTWWRAANYLSVGNSSGLTTRALEPLTLERIKPRLLGH